MLTTNSTTIIARALTSGFMFHSGDALAACDYLCREQAAREVAIPATFEGESVSFIIGLVPFQGYYSKVAQ